METQNKTNKLKESVGAIWKKISSKGNNYLFIKLKINNQEHAFVAFENQQTSDTHPNYKVYISTLTKVSSAIKTPVKPLKPKIVEILEQQDDEETLL